MEVSHIYLSQFSTDSWLLVALDEHLEHATPLLISTDEAGKLQKVLKDGKYGEYYLSDGPNEVKIELNAEKRVFYSINHSSPLRFTRRIGRPSMG